MTRPAFAVALLAVASCSPTTPTPQPKTDSPYPVKVGTKWEYIHHGDERQVSVEEITESAERGGVTTFRVDRRSQWGEKEYSILRFEQDRLMVTGTERGKYTPALLLWRAGLKDGESWTSECQEAGEVMEKQMTVGKAEKITTPAGTFTAVPITITYTKQTLPAFVDWYAEGVGLVKRTVSGRRSPYCELKSFTPVKDKK